MEYVGLAARFVLAAIFLAAATKLRHPHEYRAAVADYEILPPRLVGPVARVLPWLEVVIGAALLVGVLVVPASLLAACLLTVFAGGVWINVRRGRSIGCGCGLAQRQQISNRLVARNGVLVVLALACADVPSAALAAWPGPGTADSSLTALEAIGVLVATAAGGALVVVASMADTRLRRWGGSLVRSLRLRRPAGRSRARMTTSTG